MKDSAAAEEGSTTLIIKVSNFNQSTVTTARSNMPLSTSVFYDENFRNQKAKHVISSESTDAQHDTELECQRFFIDLNKLPKSQLEHLEQTGLLLLTQQEQQLLEEKQDIGKAKDDAKIDYDHCVLLLRSKHMHYLSQVWQTSPSRHNRPPLRSGFVSLDASRPWILYWCLHGYDLLGRQAAGPNKDEDSEISFLAASNPSTDQEESYTRMVETLERCWQSRHVILSDHISTEWLDQDPLVPSPIGYDYDGTFYEEGEDDRMVDDEQQKRVYEAGGFGGGPGQMAHAATTYAGILALCIIATTSHSSTASKMAWDLLQRLRPAIYMWMLSLQQSDGSYRMHWDGEVDVRASYTILCCAKLLNILDMRTAPAGNVDGTTSVTNGSEAISMAQQKQRRRSMSQLLLLGGPSELVVSFLVRCQTYEGGIGGEPFVEAHGGYTFCGAAALKLIHRLHKLDVDNLLGWLSRRQMSYEGGFSGRSNKLVDACYSFWQAGALALTCQEVSMTSPMDDAHQEGDCDPWLACFRETGSPSDDQAARTPISAASPAGELLMDVPMLERYILLCAQEVSGGLRDKPSKQRDFYHSCYSLSGLSIIQHYGNGTDATATTANSDSTTNKPDWYGHRSSNWVQQTHPCYNIRIDRVQHVLNHFRDLDDNDNTVPLKMVQKMLPPKM